MLANYGYKDGSGDYFISIDDRGLIIFSVFSETSVADHRFFRVVRVFRGSKGRISLFVSPGIDKRLLIIEYWPAFLGVPGGSNPWFLLGARGPAGPGRTNF